MKAYKAAQDPTSPHWAPPIMAVAAMQSGKIESMKCLLDCGFNSVLALQTAVNHNKPAFIEYLLSQREKLRIKAEVLNLELETPRAPAEVVDTDEDRGAAKKIVELLVASGAR